MSYITNGPATSYSNIGVYISTLLDHSTTVMLTLHMHVSLVAASKQCCCYYSSNRTYYSLLPILGTEWEFVPVNGTKILTNH